MFNESTLMSIFKSVILLENTKKEPEEIPTKVPCRHTPDCKGFYTHLPKENIWRCNKYPRHYVNVHTDGCIAFSNLKGHTYTCYKSFQDWVDNKQLFPSVKDL